MQLCEAKLVVLAEQLVQPLARRVQLEPIAGVRRHEGPPPAVLLDPKLANLCPRERLDELVLVQREAEVVDTRQLPLSGLDDDVDGAAFQLGQPKLEPQAVELVPAVAGLERCDLLPDSPVAPDQVEAELADVPRLDLAHLARD